MDEGTNGPTTRYQLLSSDDGVVWKALGWVHGYSQDGVLKKHFGGTPDGQVVAVPWSAWKPKQTTVRVIERRVLDDVPEPTPSEYVEPEPEVLLPGFGIVAADHEITTGGTD